MPVPAIISRVRNAIGSQSAALLRHRRPVRPPDTGGRDAAFEPARALRPHQGAGGAVRRDAVRAVVDRDDADAFRPPAACRGDADHRRRRAPPAFGAGAARRADRESQARHGPRALGAARRRPAGRAPAIAIRRSRSSSIRSCRAKRWRGSAAARWTRASTSATEPESDLACIPLRDIVYRVAMPAAWADELARRAVGDHRPAPVDRRARTEHASAARDGALPRARAQPERIIEADNESVINNLVESGVGISLIRDEIAAQSVDAGHSVDLAGLASHDEAVARLRGGPRDRPAGRGAGRCPAGSLARRGRLSSAGRHAPCPRSRAATRCDASGTGQGVDRGPSMAQWTVSWRRRCREWPRRAASSTPPECLRRLPMPARKSASLHRRAAE